VPTVASDFSSFYKTFKNMREMCSPENVLNGTANEDFKEKLKNAGIEEKLGFLNLLTNIINEELQKCIVKNNTIKETVKFLKDNEFLTNENSVLTEKDAFNSILSKIKTLCEKNEKSLKEVAPEVLKEEVEDLKNIVAASQKKLANSSKFIYDSLGDSPETKIFTSDITRNSYSAEFLIGFGCEEFSEITKTKKSDEALLQELNTLL
jgi:hypothetical protein